MQRNDVSRSAPDANCDKPGLSSVTQTVKRSIPVATVVPVATAVPVASRSLQTGWVKAS